MDRELERRIGRLEARMAPPATPPRLIVAEPGEDADAALRRVFGDDVPEQKPGKMPPPFIVAIGVEPLEAVE